MKGVLIYGPSGCGKTKNGEFIAEHYGLTNIVEEWCPGDPIPDDSLVFTTAPNVEGSMDYYDVIDAIG